MTRYNQMQNGSQILHVALPVRTPLLLETIIAVDGLVSTRQKRYPRISAAIGTCYGVHFALATVAV
ncbi:MAG TPA: hypothetical protein PKC19_23805, partial [Roseiflexaceae bacterium]|nr:hypothetical protein [Roseiflexaceae bacterium]